MKPFKPNSRRKAASRRIRAVRQREHLEKVTSDVFTDIEHAMQYSFDGIIYTEDCYNRSVIDDLQLKRRRKRIAAKLKEVGIPDNKLHDIVDIVDTLREYDYHVTVETLYSSMPIIIITW